MCNLFRLATCLTISILSYSAFASESRIDVRVDRENEALVEVRGDAAKQMYQVLVADGAKPSNKAHKGLLVGQNMSCYLESGVPICSFIMIGGSTEPNVTDGIGPYPGVTVSN